MTDELDDLIEGLGLEGGGERLSTAAVEEDNLDNLLGERTRSAFLLSALGARARGSAACAREALA